MKPFDKILRAVVLVLALIVALAYIFDYDYLFKGIAKTYLRGQNTATIDDLKLFKSHTVVSAKPKPWLKDSLYNRKKLPASLLQNLKETKTASFLIIKDGKLLHEEYWDGYNQRKRSNSFSVAKTVTVMLLGKAIEDGIIKDLDEPYSDFYENYGNLPMGKSLTLRHLAAMEAGLKWKEEYRNPFGANAKAYYGNNLGEATFLKGFKVKPGTKFEYQSGSTQLLGFAVRKAVNIPLADYLSRKLWIPLGMEQNAEWTTDEYGMEKAFCCIHAEPRDFAKLGQLMLKGGKVDSLQVLNADFVQQMITPTKASRGVYGLGVWINHDNAVKHYFMLGLQGQYVIVVPEKNMVVVRTGSYKSQPKNDRGRPDQVRFIVNEIVKNYL